MSSDSLNSDDLAKAAATRNGVLLGLLILLLAAFLLSGCVGATSTASSADGGAASGLSATPSGVSFGSVNTGSN